MKENSAQNRAISHDKGPMMLLAGPGSGKTTTITKRVVNLIQEKKVTPSSILVVTFTKAAAREMKERFLRLCKEKNVNAPYEQVTFGTFHGVYYTILKYAYHLNAQNILSEERKYDILKEIVYRQKLTIEDEKEFFQGLVQEISMVKNGRIPLEHYYSANCPDDTFRAIYQAYVKRCKTSKLLDFDDILLYTYELLTNRNDILRSWQKRFSYILVDEFQDINQLQYDVVKLLAKPEDNLFIVGDDDQSIYAFRGAKPEIMLHFPEDYPDAKTELLACNYRSASTIVELSQKVISENSRRYKKELFADRMGGNPVIIQAFEDGKQEEVYVKNQVQKLLKEGIPYEEMAVLYRTNSGARFLVETLMRYQIPFCMRDTLPNLYEHWIAQDVISYIRIAMGERSRREFLRIMNRPNRYFSRDALDDAQVSFEGLRWFYEEKDWMCDRIDKLEEDLNTLKRMTPYGAINYIRYGIGYEEYLKEYAQYRKIKTEELFEVMEELALSAKGFKSFSDWFVHIEEYTQQLKEQAKKQASEKKGITISTLHSIKGLEFDAVFLMDVNEGSLPYHKAVTESSIEEERRLFYVGITRARKFLWILYAKNRHDKELEVSRFLTESGLVLKEEKDKKK
ncbi:ATP-dependent helicase [Blautia stercoris]|uniref:ATP-dependent helicase n=1 Tax=Blautia stercoris TaxID=871664 RepID=UPI00355C5FBE